MGKCGRIVDMLAGAEQNGLPSRRSGGSMPRLPVLAAALRES